VTFSTSFARSRPFARIRTRIASFALTCRGCCRYLGDIAGKRLGMARRRLTRAGHGRWIVALESRASSRHRYLAAVWMSHRGPRDSSSAAVTDSREERSLKLYVKVDRR